MGKSVRKQPRCSMCGALITESLIVVSPANDWLCLDCSGATIGDLVDEDEYAEDRVETLRAFHGID